MYQKPNSTPMWFARTAKHVFALGVSIAVMTTTDSSLAAAHQRIEVYRFNEKLVHARPYMWNVEEGPPLSPVYVVAGSGDILAMVRPTKGGPLFLKRWTTEGKLVNSRTLGVTEEVVASSLSVDATLTLVTHSELIQVAVPREDPPARIALPDTAKGSKRVGVGPRGAWFEVKDQLVRVGLDGTSVVKLPLFKVPAQFTRCGADQAQQLPCEYVAERSLLATADGGCVVTESVVHDFPVPNSHQIDHAGTYVLSSLSSTGQLRAQSARGEVKSPWEWFWSDSRGSMNSPTFGLVRTRHAGTEGLAKLAERANGDFLLLTDEPDAVWRVDRSFNKIWKTSIYRPFADDVVSPSWTRGVLISGGGTNFTVLDDAGKNLRKGYYYDAAAMTRADNSIPKFAIGQSRNGEWLIVNY